MTRAVLGLILLLVCSFGSAISAQSDNLTNAPAGKQWVDAATAEGIVQSQLSTLQVQLTNLQNQGAQGVELELAKVKVQFYTDLNSALQSGQPVFHAFDIAYATMESTFLGDYLDVKVLNDSQLVQIREEARTKLTI
ncbi:MAG: hypothetical protein IPJ06_06520 [Saprospiraceae bacterium]|nr:hypothetical protein [Saprospiraceae bacterium]